MRAEGALKHFITAFAIAAVGYLAIFYGIEHLRTRKGPWQLSFAAHEEGGSKVPLLTIAQPDLGIRNVTLAFQGEMLRENFVPQVWVAGEPKKVPFPLPFGSVIFLDTTILPGTVTMNVFDHEIELLPRTLIIDHQEHPWVNGTNILLQPTSSRKTTQGESKLSGSGY
jgi:hypothetical protein